MADIGASSLEMAGKMLLLSPLCSNGLRIGVYNAGVPQIPLEAMLVRCMPHKCH